MGLAPQSRPPNTSPVPEPVAQTQDEQNISEQSQLEAELGFQIRGVLGGLPVAEQRQEYFAVFDQAGDTGPELIDKTQYRITYLVDSKLNTSKPAENAVSAVNATQNFEEGARVSVRADNATSLNRSLTGELGIYDIGTLRLISTTETGSTPEGFLQTMSFVQPNGQSIISDALDLSIQYNLAPVTLTQPNYGTSTIIGPDGLLLFYPSASKAISGSTDPFYDGIDSTPHNTLEILRDTTEGGTRIAVNFNVFLQADWSVQSSPIPQPVEGYIQLEFQDAGAGDFIVIDTATYSIPPNNTAYFYPGVSAGNFGHFQAGSKFRCRLFRTDTSLGGAQLKLMNGKCKIIQEYLPGNVNIPGLNAVTASYFEPDFTTFKPVSESQNPAGYSILTSSVQMGYFINNGFQARLEDECKAFDPKGDTVTFEAIQVPFTWEIGDEIRFEYNKNKVHKIIGVDKLSNGAYHITVSPNVSSGSIINHFTHYRIVEDGGYLILNTIKDNQVAGNQPFNGIILPKYPSENLKEKEDRLIFELKQAGIIEV